MHTVVSIKARKEFKMTRQDHPNSAIKYYSKEYARQLKLMQEIIAIEQQGLNDDLFIPSQALQTTFINLMRAAERLTALTEFQGR